MAGRIEGEAIQQAHHRLSQTTRTDMPLSKMMNEVQDYPAEERAALADAVLQTLNPIDPAAQAEWLETAVRRRGEILSRSVHPIPVEEVLAEAHARAEG